jgi:hypothetical protein
LKIQLLEQERELRSLLNKKELLVEAKENSEKQYSMEYQALVTSNAKLIQENEDLKKRLYEIDNSLVKSR